MGKTKFGTKIVFFFVILLGAGAVLYAKNCMEQLAAYAVSLMDGAGQAQAQSQLAAMIASDVKKMAAFMAAGLIITIVVGAAGIIDYIRSLDLQLFGHPRTGRFHTGCGTEIFRQERQHRKPCGSFPQDPGELCGTSWEREGQCRVPERPCVLHREKRG